jgi:hypothetical protein
MSKGFIVVDEKDWKEIAPERRDWLIFNTLKSMDARLQSLERWNKALSFAGGMLGGVLATLGIKLL